MANGQVNQNNSKVYYGPSASLAYIMYWNLFDVPSWELTYIGGNSVAY